MNAGPHAHYNAPNPRTPQDRPGSDALVREGSTYLTDLDSEKFCQTFADGLESGIGYARVLDILGRQGFDKKTIGRLRRALLERGDNLAGALARYGILDPAARKLILVADQQGVLPQTFQQLSAIYGTRYKRKREFVTALVEPMILVALGMIVFRNLIGSGLTELTFAHDTTQRIINIGIQSAIESAIFGLTCFSVAFVWLNLPVDFAPRDIFSRIWLRLPLVSDPGRLMSISTFCRYLQQAIAGGMTVYQGLELASEASNHPGILRTMPRAQARLEEGHTLAKALYEIKALPVEVLENVDIGEESGRLDERLSFLAERYATRSLDAFRNRMNTYIALSRYGIIILVIVMIFVALFQMGGFEM